MNKRVECKQIQPRSPSIEAGATPGHQNPQLTMALSLNPKD